MLTRLVGKITIRIIYYNNLLAIFHEPTLEVEIQTNYYFEPQGKNKWQFMSAIFKTQWDLKPDLCQYSTPKVELSDQLREII